MKLRIGDEVRYEIRGGGYAPHSGVGVVIGWMPYAPSDVVLLAGKNGDGSDYGGFPLNKEWCEKTGGKNIAFARTRRADYQKNYGRKSVAPITVREPK